MSTANLAEELLACDWIKHKVCTDDGYAQNLYAAFCNMQWQKLDAWPVLLEQRWSISWRSAGSLIASIRGQGNYMDWYCSGMSSGYGDDAQTPYVEEGIVSEAIAHDLRQLGWVPIAWD
jgi:hypothetical protein